MITDSKMAPTALVTKDPLQFLLRPGPSLTDRAFYVGTFGHSFKVARVDQFAPIDGTTDVRIPVGPYRVEDLSANGDITERAVWRAPVAGRILDSVKALQEAASTAIDGSNTAVITLRNITQANDIATVTLTADVAANAATALTLSAANADVAAGDILGVVVTQGTAADLARFNLVFEFSPDRALGTLSLSGVIIPNGSGIITAPVFEVDATPEDFKVAAFKALVGGKVVEKAAETGISFSAAHVVTAAKWGVITIQMSDAGVISTVVPSATQAYDSRGAAVAAIAAADSGKLKAAVFVINAGVADWDANTDDLTDASDLTTLEILDEAAIAKFITAKAWTAGKHVLPAISTNTDAVGRAGDYLVLLYTSSTNNAQAEALAAVTIRPYPANGEVMTKP